YPDYHSDRQERPYRQPDGWFRPVYVPGSDDQPDSIHPCQFTNPQMSFRRVIWIVLDSVGIGEMPDAAQYGDACSDTLGHIAQSRKLHLNNLCSLGLGNIRPLDRLPPDRAPKGAYGKCSLASPGKDTTTGHWEMTGIHLEKPFP